MPRCLFTFREPTNGFSMNNKTQDVLTGFKLKNQDSFPQAIFTNDEKDSISGYVFEISGDELRKLDQHKNEGDQRVFVTLKSGKKAFVYVSIFSSFYSEKQKMLAGILYDGSDKEVENDHIKAKKQFTIYNAIDVADLEKRSQFLKTFLDVRGERIHIESPFYCDFGYNISIGENFYSNFNCCILDVNLVMIGDNVMFGPNVQIYTATHPLNAFERIKGPELGYPIWIGDNVWIGGGAIICSNVQIGNNTTIGAGSVVTKDIPANVFAAGNPCRIIRKL